MWLKSRFDFLKRLFLNGLFTLLPVTVTFWVLRFLYRTSLHMLEPLRALEPVWLQHIPGAELYLVAVFLLMIGLLAHFLIITPLVHLLEKIIHKIPLARIVYASVKTMVDFFDAPRHPEFKRKVVLVEYPAKNMYKIAFLLGEVDDIGALIPSAQGKKMVKVFMPTSHITTGFMLFVLESQLIVTNISFEDAIKMTISCGVIHPKNIGPLDDQAA